MIMISDKRYALNFIFIFIDIHGSVFVFENYSRKGGGDNATADCCRYDMQYDCDCARNGADDIPYSIFHMLHCSMRYSWQLAAAPSALSLLYIFSVVLLDFPFSPIQSHIDSFIRLMFE
jgi:hypothetical protein